MLPVLDAQIPSDDFTMVFFKHATSCRANMIVLAGLELTGKTPSTPWLTMVSVVHDILRNMYLSSPLTPLILQGQNYGIGDRTLLKILIVHTPLFVGGQLRTQDKTTIRRQHNNRLGHGLHSVVGKTHAERSRSHQISGGAHKILCSQNIKSE